MRTIIAAGFSAFLLLAVPLAATAHHYFANFQQEEIVLRGTLVEAFLGNPHGILTIKANDQQWDAHLGAANHSRRLGLNNVLFERGDPIVVYGHPSVVPEKRELMTTHFIYDGVRYDVFFDTDDR